MPINNYYISGFRKDLFIRWWSGLAAVSTWCSYGVMIYVRVRDTFRIGKTLRLLFLDVHFLVSQEHNVHKFVASSEVSKIEKLTTPSCSIIYFALAGCSCSQELPCQHGTANAFGPLLHLIEDNHR